MPRADFSHEHQCVDWDALNDWAAKRAISEETMKSLKHPIRGEYVLDWRNRKADSFDLGPAFPDGQGSKLGASEDQSPTVFEDSLP